MTTYNWRSVWQPMTRGGFEVVDVRLVSDDPDWIRYCIYEDFRYHTYHADASGAVQIRGGRHEGYDLLPQAVGDEVDPLLKEARRLLDVLYRDGECSFSDCRAFLESTITRLESGEQGCEQQRLLNAAVVSTLPYTSDGIPAFDGLVVECPKGHQTTIGQLGSHGSRIYCCHGDCWDDGCQSDSGSGTQYQMSQCKSVNSRAAIASLIERNPPHQPAEVAASRPFQRGDEVVDAETKTEIGQISVDPARGSFHRQNPDRYFVLWANYSHGRWETVDSLLLKSDIPPTPRFKVGDRAEVLRSKAMRGMCTGSTHVVSDVLNDGYLICLDGSSSPWEASNFELVAPSDQAAVTDAFIAAADIEANSSILVAPSICPACGNPSSEHRHLAGDEYLCPESVDQVVDANKMARGADLIALERLRHEQKGWTNSHDDDHTDGSLLHAALLIGCHVAGHELAGVDPPSVDGPWPDQLVMHVAEKYQGDQVRQLVIAGSMIAAEIDRLQRKAGK